MGNIPDMATRGWGICPKWPHRDLTQVPPVRGRRKSFFPQKLTLGLKTAPQKVEIEGAGPPWRDPQRNSAPNPGTNVQNGATATQLVKQMCDLGSVGVPGPASTPCGRDPNLDLQKKSSIAQTLPNIEMGGGVAKRKLGLSFRGRFRRNTVGGI